MKKSFFQSIYYNEYEQERKEGTTTLPYILRSVDYAKRDGFQGIEVHPIFEYVNIKDGHKEYSKDALDLAKRFCEKIDEEGLTVPCFSCDAGFLSDPDNSIEMLKRSIDICEIIGSPYIHHTLQGFFKYKNAEPRDCIYQNVEKVFVEKAREVAEYAGERGITCLYEDQGYYVNTVDRMGSLISKIDMPNTGFCLDVGNSYFCNVLPEVFAGAFMPLIKHVHVKDYIRSSRNSFWKSITQDCLTNCVVGTGIVNFEKIFYMLLSAGYDGFFTLEDQDAVNNLSLKAEIDEIKISMNNLEAIYNRVAGALGISGTGDKK